MRKGVKRTALFYALNTLLPLAAGAAIYLTLRRDSYVGSFVGALLGLPERESAAGPSGFSAFLRDHAADMLWAYALAFAVCAVTGGGRRARRAALCVCLGFAALVESAQLLGAFSGTFDPLDILLEALAIGLAFLFIHIFEEGKNEKNSENH